MFNNFLQVPIKWWLISEIEKKYFWIKIDIESAKLFSTWNSNFVKKELDNRNIFPVLISANLVVCKNKKLKLEILPKVLIF